ncbi:VENN motif pre-toxin domain-containing protein, partial [Photorhabdus temperata]|uniref:VENN motif pre-toxin domain-containing protein n=1 Tax=Photorhabdus temperata TaxID=574560 RepID=UPI0004CEF46B
STLAAGLAGGIAGDSTGSTVAGAQAGKNAVENNALSLPKGMADYGRAQSSLAMKMYREGATPDQLSEELARQTRGTHPEGQDPARGLIVAWGNFFGVPLDVVMSNEKMTPEKAASIVASGVPTSEAKVMQYVAAKAFLSLAKNPMSGSKTESTLPQWSAGEGKFNPKYQGTVTNVEHQTGKFDGKSLPNEKGSIASNKTIKNDVLDNPRVGTGEKGTGSGNKVDQIPNKTVVDIDGKEISVYPNRNKPTATQEFPPVAKAHGFNDIVDNYAGLATQTKLKNGATLYQLPGSLRTYPKRNCHIV